MFSKVSVVILFGYFYLIHLLSSISCSQRHCDLLMLIQTFTLLHPLLPDPLLIHSASHSPRVGCQTYPRSSRPVPIKVTQLRENKGRIEKAGLCDTKEKEKMKRGMSSWQISAPGRTAVTHTYLLHLLP